MKQTISIFAKWVVVGVMAVMPALVASGVINAANSHGVTMSPMNEKIIINPGESFEGSFMLSNPSSQTEETRYEVSAESFYTNEDGELVFGVEGSRGDIVNWITVEPPTSGTIEPNEVKKINFRIDVPENAPAGGQYASIVVTMKDKEGENNQKNDNGSGAVIDETWRVAHLVYAEVTGDTVRSGEILDANVPSFLFSGNIKGTSSVKNTGNVHGEAKYKLQVFPLFSSEEVYSNEDDPATKTILPDRTYYSEIDWGETPSIGIFNVLYTVEFEGSVAQVSKMVIICPIWLLFIIFFVIIVLIMWIVMRVRGKKKAAPKEDA